MPVLYNETLSQEQAILQICYSLRTLEALRVSQKHEQASICKGFHSVLESNLPEKTLMLREASKRENKAYSSHPIYHPRLHPKIRLKTCRVVDVHVFNPSMWEAEAGGSL